MKPAILAGLACSSLFLAPRASPPEAAPGAIGPGGVIAMHESLFAALDRADAEGVKGRLGSISGLGACVDSRGQWSDPPSFLVALIEPGAAAKTAADPAAGAEALLEWARSETPLKTRILSGWSDCYSKDIGFAILEFERRGADGERARRYQSTSFARSTDEGWKLYFWQVAAVASDGSAGPR
jgi:hypothetical protein